MVNKPLLYCLLMNRGKNFDFDHLVLLKYWFSENQIKLSSTTVGSIQNTQSFFSIRWTNNQIWCGFMRKIHKPHSLILNTTFLTNDITTSFNQKLVTINTNTIFAVDTVHRYLRRPIVSYGIGTVKLQLETKVKNCPKIYPINSAVIIIANLNHR